MDNIIYTNWGGGGSIAISRCLPTIPVKTKTKHKIKTLGYIEHKLICQMFSAWIQGEPYARNPEMELPHLNI